MNALRLFVALVILLTANQCAVTRSHAAPPKLPPHYFVYELVMHLDKQRVPTGTAFKTAELCHGAAVEENKRASRAVHFECEPLIVLKE